MFILCIFFTVYHSVRKCKCFIPCTFFTVSHSVRKYKYFIPCTFFTVYHSVRKYKCFIPCTPSTFFSVYHSVRKYKCFIHCTFFQHTTLYLFFSIPLVRKYKVGLNFHNSAQTNLTFPDRLMLFTIDTRTSSQCSARLFFFPVCHFCSSLLVFLFLFLPLLCRSHELLVVCGLQCAK